jgi:hypothetical protein
VIPANNVIPTPPTEEIPPIIIPLDVATEEYISQKPVSNGTVQFSDSKGATIGMATLTSLGLLAVIAGSLSYGCLNLGSSFMKLFLVIKLIGKCIYLPIWYKGILLHTLYSMAIISGHF